MSVHRVRRYVPMVVWKWAFCALVLLFWVLMYRGIWWQGLVVDAVVIGGLLVAGRLPPSAGLQAVEVRPEGLRLRFADELEPALLGWADILDVSYSPGRVENQRIGGGRELTTLHHAAVALLIRDQPGPLVLVHVHRPQQLAVSIATHVARSRT
ncbi:hypothetical protein [Streptomyces novaecaesareae]|uniref:hypothetical protein n=1 Tax=Streptomyces novaecaesareae TaxID=68244 RepID=UPI0012FF3190|nr:hypothetical protein [Streptomyces novaecaesareae]